MLKLSLFSECIGYWTGVHNLHWSNQPISRRSILGCPIFPYAIHPWHWFTIWNARRSYHITCWYETVSKSAKRYDRWGMYCLRKNKEVAKINYELSFPSQILCVSCFVISITFAHGAGSYIFQLMDSFAGSYSLLIIAFFECIAVSYVYGIKRYLQTFKLQ